MDILYEGSPIAQSYENSLSDTGISRVNKNLLHKMEQVLKDSPFSFMLFSQNSYWENFLLHKFIYDNKFINIKGYVDGVILPYLSNINLNAININHIKNELSKESFDLSKFFYTYKNEKFIFHASFYPVPDIIRNLKNSKVIHTIHDIFPKTHKYLFNEDIQVIFNEIISTYYPEDAYISVSDFTNEKLIEEFSYLNKKNCFVVKNSADHYEFEQSDNSAVLKSHGIKNNSYNISISTLEPRKNLMNLVRGYAEYFEKSRSKFPLVIVGNKGWVNDLEYSDFTKYNFIHFTGKVSNSELQSLIQNARLYISGSICEGFGLGALESLFLGTPCLVPNNSAQSEIGKLSFLSNDCTAESFAMKLMDIEENHPKKVVDIKLIKSNYSWLKSANEHLRIYAKLLLG
jgi:hypothetical protein